MINNNEDYLTRNNTEGHFTTSAWIFNKDRTKVLMIYHNIYDTWAWIGGHADGEEDLFEVIKREITEETGLENFTPLSTEIYGVNIGTVKTHFKNNKLVEEHLHLDIEYVFEADEEDYIRIKEDENSGVKWIELDRLEEYIFDENMINVYKSLTERLKYLGEI